MPSNINHIYQKPSGSQNRSDSTHKFFIRTDLDDDKTLMKTTMVTSSLIMKMLLMVLMMSSMSMWLISNHESNVTELGQMSEKAEVVAEACLVLKIK